MASKYLNLFDLLAGDEEGDDVSVLYDRMKQKAVEDVPSSPPKTRKEHIVFEQAHGNGNENGTKSDEEGWQVVSKKAVKKVQENGNEHANGDGSEQAKGGADVNSERPMTNGAGNGNMNGRGDRKRGNGGYRGQRGRRGRASDNGEVKDLSNGGNGDGVDAGDSNVNSEGDAGVTVESSNGKETEEQETTEEVKIDLPEPEETAEERKERERLEQIRKEREERRRLWEQEKAEEARKMTLDQYEKKLLEKKQALNLQKAEARRVVSAEEDFENMKQVGKKKDNDETLVVEKEKPNGKAVLVKSTSEPKLKKSGSFEKGRKPQADGLAKLFRPASFRGGRSGRGRDSSNQGGFGRRFPTQNGSSSDGPQTNNGQPPAAEDLPAAGDETLKYNLQFPVLGSVPPPAPPSESSEPPANPSTSSGPNSSAPSSKRSGSKVNHSHTGPSSTTTADNRPVATTSATAANSSVSAESSEV
ncbi:hypothetical protein KSS87_009237 [Heliosperma pusillum]|nr:hypothetical protein KSS87_009237 [Heliosperma pusillum]